ncbi:unnamed protein product [Allacma fusca]|uniref:F-box domain-containing protein n=1 Tax=Allacma fusca TaxID=39272 RepID=A0A8J2PKF5_9HEXA|nr:unnamed protein product [Allacma fusca]
MLLLSDEVLLMILRHLNSSAVFTLSRTCKRLRNLCHDKEFSRHIDAPPDDYETLDLIFNSLLDRHTTSLRLASKCHGENSAFRSSIAPSHLAQICPSLRPNPSDINLTNLYLIRQRLDKSIFNLSSLPPSLRVLHLSGTIISNVTEQSGYFKNISEALPNLEDFDLTDCTWVPSHSLLGISKLPALKRLSLRGCREIGNCLAYSSLAFRFGFPSLKVLDVTNTQFGTGEFHSISLLKNLEELYVGEYDLQQNSNAIQDFSLHELIGLAHLQKIDLSGQDITDTGLNVLVRVPSLRRIDAHFTAITSGAIERFKQLRNGCIINKNMSYFEY